MAAKNWMAAESRREKHAGTKGIFKAKAERAHMGTNEFAHHVLGEESGASTKTKRQASMALRYAAARG
jgi:hypothetical protein